ncbi:MAG: hypothetical protein H0W64_03755 [Gammaproteobacteria bacterium]|nr:hypothetical protein [Gammaproteobacteria bacterium]
MKKGNVIDFLAYQLQQEVKIAPNLHPISDELQRAIENLIERMRQFDPIT